MATRFGPRPDSFTILIAITVGLASVLPCRGWGADAFKLATGLAVALLFFLHGARLSRETVLKAVTHWRLHLVVLACTFAVFPLLGLLLNALGAELLSDELQAGFLFLCAVPSTVQSSIAFTALARGNVAAAVCSASASSLLGVLLTPLLVELLGLRAAGSVALSDVVMSLLAQLFVPFVLGQLLRGRLERWVTVHAGKLRAVDQGTILLAVYTAFSAAMVEGLWRTLPPAALLALLGLVAVLLGCALLVTWRAGKLLGFSRADQIVIVFCGSKKSLASGVPFANVLFSAGAVGAMVLPLMLYHQLQLMVCAVIAQRYGAVVADQAAAETAPL